ncbi:hypothetical protein NC653_027310 [Populus alba x Populus x berolinensis]|uniref:Uncharacterized protein n=1 Tax=Populus alba x Populus x berolinensis TaxID=444605 RepID=A0AAD6M4Y4_9ROSI|nr:hypothetical protein NC653_027310 [Populus alba x Populus x berolinensis]
MKCWAWKRHGVEATAIMKYVCLLKYLFIIYTSIIILNGKLKHLHVGSREVGVARFWTRILDSTPIRSSLNLWFIMSIGVSMKDFVKIQLAFSHSTATS